MRRGMLFGLVLGINIISVALAARINNIAVFTEIIGTVVVALILIVLFATKPLHPVSFLFNTGGVTGFDIIKAVPFAALIGIFTIVGFELAADLSEEAVNARVTVPKAVIWSVVSSGVLGMIALIGFALAIPNLKTIAASPVPIADATGGRRPEVVDRLVEPGEPDAQPLDGLTERERMVLRLMAEGHSNEAICDLLGLRSKTVETHVARIFSKLGLERTPATNRRVVAVLTYLRS